MLDCPQPQLHLCGQEVVVLLSFVSPVRQRGPLSLVIRTPGHLPPRQNVRLFFYFGVLDTLVYFHKTLAK